MQSGPGLEGQDEANRMPSDLSRGPVEESLMPSGLDRGQAREIRMLSDLAQVNEVSDLIRSRVKVNRRGGEGKLRMQRLRHMLRMKGQPRR